MDHTRLISTRASSISASGLRKVYDRVESLKAQGRDAINLGVGQPDFAVPMAIKNAAWHGLLNDMNGYMPTAGIPELRARLAANLNAELGWAIDPSPGAAPDSANITVTGGTSGAIYLLMQALCDSGDEVIVPDPYFVLYPYCVRLAGGTPVLCDTYPDFRMTASRVEKLITPRTKAVLVSSPGNPSGVVLTQRELDDLCELCASRGVLLISDEIYDQFTFDRGPGERPASPARHARFGRDVMLVRGFGKTYGFTGWRLGYAAGPRALIAELIKLQQYSFICTPGALQAGALAALDVNMTGYIQAYAKRRDMVVNSLSGVTEITRPGGAFYVFAKVPEKLAMTASQFCDAAVEKGVVVMPGNVFSPRDTHFRISYTVGEADLARAVEILRAMMA